jgi:hypothetical protein
VEALFDYQPSKWYRGCEPPKPPPRPEASEIAKRIFRKIGEDALRTMPLTEEQKRGVRAGLIELGEEAELIELGEEEGRTPE